MESLTYHFLFNLSLMLVLFYIFFMLLKHLRFNRFRTIVATYFSAALLLSFVFSFQLNGEYIVDLRFIPFLIGGLYFKLSPLLGMILIVLRGFYNIDEGFYMSALFYGVMGYFFWKLSPIFMDLEAKQKIIIASVLTVLESFGTLLLLSPLIPSEQMLDVWFAYLTVPVLSTVIITSMIELIAGNMKSQSEIVKEEKLKAIEQMGAAISHDIRNPLTTAIGFTELLESDNIDGHNRKLYTSILRSELERAEQIIQDYLTFTKPPVLSTAPVDVNEEIDQIVQLLQPLANYHSVVIDTKLNASGFIEVDRPKFQESFITIIRNSIQTLNNGGNIKIDTYSRRKKVIIIIQSLPSDASVGVENDHNDQNGTLRFSHNILRAMKGTFETSNDKNRKVFQVSFKRTSTSLLNFRENVSS